MDEVLDDETLMVRVARGDRAAYARLYERWGDPTFRFLARRTGGRTEAEEAHQETWLRVYRYRGTFDPSRRFKAWLFKIAANCGRDTRRPEPELFSIAARPDEPDDLRDRLVDGLAALDRDDRTLLLLAIEGFEGEEIAQMLGIGPGAVRMRLVRARSRLRERIGEADA